MNKLVRVSNLLRGKKLVISSGNFVEFLAKVRAKFDLLPDINISLEDDQGAEVDEEVFPVLLDQLTIPTIVFHIAEEGASEIDFSQDSPACPQIVYVNSPVSPSPHSPASTSSYHQDEEYFYQILESYVAESVELADLVADCKNKGCVDQAAATILINRFVAKLVELKGPSPSTRDQKLFAAGIVKILPCWRYPESSDGIDILYDDVNRSGLIQTRLRAIHRNIRGSSTAVSTPKRSSANSATGPKPKHPKQNPSDCLPIDDEKIIELNAASSKDGGSEIKRLMRETLEHRNYLRVASDNTILKTYTKFGECPFAINFEFSLMHPDEGNHFLNKWPALSDAIVKNARGISKSPALIKFANEEYGNWDNSIGALLILSHLIPPTAQGKGKGSRCKINDTKGRVLSFFKTNTPLQSILDTWNKVITQPNLLCLGENTANISSFYIICDGIILPLDSQNSTEAIDSLFKSHYVFGTDYDVNLKGLWQFLQVYVYKLDMDTRLPRRVKEVFAQLHQFI